MNDLVQQLKLVLGLEGTEKAEAQLGGINKSVASIGKSVVAAAAAFITFRKAINIATEAMKAHEQALIAMRQIEGTLQATGKAAEYSAQELSKMAGELQAVSNFGDEDILQGATMSLLRFDGISKDMFPRVQRMAVDLGEAMGGLENASRTLGISLADPTLGITRLRRAGVMFTESQEATIKALVEVGDKAGAQEILLSGLEEKYKGLAFASISATTQMNNAWDDYLEAMGKSLTFIDGFKKTITIALVDISSSIDTTSKAAQREALLSQQAWGETLIKTINIGKALLAGFGGIVQGLGNYYMTVFTNVSNVGKLYFNAIQTAIMKTAQIAVKYNPFSLLAAGAEEAVKKITGKDFGFSTARDKLLSDIKALEGDIGGAWDNLIKGFGTTKSVWQDWAKNALAIPSNTKSMIERQVNQLRDLTQKQLDALDMDMPALLGLDEDVLKGLSDGLKDIIDKTLQAQAYYYEQTAKYSDEWITSQLKLYKADLDDNLSTWLTKEQIDELYSAKHKQLLDEQTKHFTDAEAKKQAELKASLDAQIASHEEFMRNWKTVIDTQRQMELDFTQNRERWLEIKMQILDDEVEAHRQAGVDIVVLERWKANEIKKVLQEIPEHLKALDDYSQDIAKRIQDGAIYALSDGLHGLLTGAQTLEDVWKNVWKNILDATMRAISQMIAKMIVLKTVQTWLGGGILNFGGVAGSTPTGFFDLPAIPVASFGGKQAVPAGDISSPAPTIRTRTPINIGTSVGGGNNELLTAIKELKNEIAKDREFNFNMYMDGMPLRNALRRTERRINSLGSGYVS